MPPTQSTTSSWRVGKLVRASGSRPWPSWPRPDVATAEAIRVLAERFGVWPRQARRYVDQAASVGRV